MSGYTKILVALLAIAAVIGSTLGEIAAARTAQRSSGSADNASSPACSEPGQVVDRGNGWTSTAIPRFPPLIEGGDILPAQAGLGGNRSARSFAVDPRDPTRVFVTDGYTIMRSLDRGCSWDVVFRATEVLPIEIPLWPVPWGTEPISQIEIPETTGSDDGAEVYALVSDQAMPYAPTKTWIVAGNRKGDPDRWAVRSELLLTTPTWDQPPPLLEFSPRDPEVGYLVHHRRYDNAASRQLDQLVTYGTTDGGNSWSLRSEIPSQMNPRRLIVGDNETLWVLDSEIPGPYALSTDGGFTWQENREFLFGQGVLDLDSTELNGKDVLVGLLVGPNPKPDPDGYTQLGIYMGLSRDQGLKWERWAPTRGRTPSAGVAWRDHQFGVGPTADSMLYASATNVWRFDRRLVGRSQVPPWVDVTPVGLPKGGSSPHGYATFQDVAVSLDGRNPIYSVLMHRPVSSDPLVPPPPQEIWQYTGPRQRAARG